jgi:cytochrome c oxidase subunit 2
MAAGATAAMCMAATAAFAAEGQAENWQLGFQPPASPIAGSIENVHTFLLIIVSGIVLFVLGLLVWVMVRYNEKANPTHHGPSHNTTVEVLDHHPGDDSWSSSPSVLPAAMFAQYNAKGGRDHQGDRPAMVLDYEYPDYGSLSFSSTILEDSELKPGQPRLLSVDNE